MKKRMAETDTIPPHAARTLWVARTLLSVLRPKGRKLKPDFHGRHAAIADRSVRYSGLPRRIACGWLHFIPPPLYHFRRSFRATQKSRRADRIGATRQRTQLIVYLPGKGIA